jgi:trk system potassium uptake protein TrkH
MSQNDKKLKTYERIFKILFVAGDRYKSFIGWFNGFCRLGFSITFFLFLIAFLFYIGFINSEENSRMLRSMFRILFFILFFLKFLPEIMQIRKKAISSIIVGIIVFLFSFGVFLSNFHIINDNKSLWDFFNGNTQVVIAIFLLGLSEISSIARVISSIKIPPALLFATSFLVIILIGSGLLLMPKAHAFPLSFLDSFFTSASAVCVTGLIVVDTSTAFTTLGKIIILCLIQIGGLGIMTFTGFFSYIFTSGSSFRDRLLLKEIFSSKSMSNLFKVLTEILLLTFLTEIIGVIIIYISLDDNSSNRLLSSLFHSVSAFCNAGFSTLSDNLYSTGIRYNYGIQLSVALLIILGGLGFPVLLKVYSNLKHFIIVITRRVRGKHAPVLPEQRNVSGRIVLFMTAFLIMAGTGLYYFFEKETSLSGMDHTQKFIVSFFGSVSARTAGFNIIDISLWGYPTVFLMILLMWIGASPGSTGGGIKTTTFAIALRSVWNNIRGRQQLVIGNREIGHSTIIRVLSIILLSILTITAGFFCLLVFEQGKNPVHLLFESVSAFCTVGLSLANTSTFSQAGKIVVILLMFIGRVGPLTLLTGLMVSYHKKYSRYPEIDIIIN